MFHTVSRSRVTLPRLSIAGLMLAFVLSATVATTVGVAAWSLGTSAGPSVETIRKTAYQQGMTAGEARGRTAAALRVRNHAYAKGRSVGYRIGLRKGIHRGRVHALTTGRAEGYKSGYAAGVAQGRVEGAASSRHTKHPKN
jgi:flagellar biosynthesis/type III secretory pathway protein FliH